MSFVVPLFRSSPCLPEERLSWYRLASVGEYGFAGKRSGLSPWRRLACGTLAAILIWRWEAPVLLAFAPECLGWLEIFLFDALVPRFVGRESKLKKCWLEAGLEALADVIPALLR